MTKRKTETVNDLSRCLDPLDTDATLIAVIEMSQSSWLVAGIVPGVERQPLKKLAIDERALLNLLSRWRAEAEKKGHRITRIAVAFEAASASQLLWRSVTSHGRASSATAPHLPDTDQSSTPSPGCWSAVRSPGSRTRSVRTCQGLRPRRASRALANSAPCRFAFRCSNVVGTRGYSSFAAR